jgi:hypothetical protein
LSLLVPKLVPLPSLLPPQLPRPAKLPTRESVVGGVGDNKGGSEEEKKRRRGSGSMRGGASSSGRTGKAMSIAPIALQTVPDVTPAASSSSTVGTRL